MDVALRVAELQPNKQVRCAYLELMQPNLATVAADLIENNACQHIQIIPMFLGVGKHAREDLPEIVNALRTANPSIVFELTPSLGERADVLKAIANAIGV